MTLFAILAVVACVPVTQTSQSSGVPGITLRAEGVGAGVVRLTLSNDTSSAAGYNLCTSALQRRDGDTWAEVRTSEVCTMDLRTLDPGHSATFDKNLPAGIPNAVYRYVTGIETPLGTAQRPAASNPFEVR